LLVRNFLLLMLWHVGVFFFFFFSGVVVGGGVYMLYM